MRFLQEAYAEIKGTPEGMTGSTNLDTEKYEEALAQAKTLPKDVLVGEVWDYAENARRCDNGGWNAYMCPAGCHTVPFSLGKNK